MPSPRPCHRVGNTADVHVEETDWSAVCEGGSVRSAHQNTVPQLAGVMASKGK